MDELAESYNRNELMNLMHILKTAKNWKVDLLVMGTHGRMGLKHLFMGSIAEHLIQHSSIPVMVVP